MKKYEKQIKEIIDKVTIDRTFSLEALNQIKELKDGFDQISLDLEAACSRIQDYQDRESSREEELNEAIRGYNEIKEKEVEINKLIEEQKIKDEINKAMKSERDLVLRMFETVFKNPVVQKNSFKNIPMKDNNGYIYTGTETENGTEEINK